MLTGEQQLFEQLNKAKKILITFPKTWGGDGVATALAWYLYLKKLDKSVEVVADRVDGGRVYSFLPGYGDIKNELENLRKFIISLDISKAKVGQVKYAVEDNALNFIISPKEGFFRPEDITTRVGGFNYDLVLTLDTPDLEALGRVYDQDTDFFYQTPVVNIDHRAENEGYGQINLIELTAVATAQISFDLMSAYNRELIDEDIATCLLAGLIAKTRSFKSPNVTPAALTAASQLIALGGRREDILDRLYRSRSFGALKLWGRVLARLASSPDKTLVWSVLSAADFEKTGTTEDDLPEIIDELIVNVPTTRATAIIYELPPQNGGPRIRTLVYAGRNLNALQLLKIFDPEGTKSRARATLNESLAEAEARIIAALDAKLKEIPE